MKRLTVNSDGKWQLNEGVDVNDAIERLAKYEEFQAKMIDSQGEIVEELAKLRAEGKEKTVQYRELFTKKLLTNNVLAFLRYHGIKED
ncbi:MAG TPA: hypothetical protein DIC19_03105 [Erysipelotrichaceae bacterium]|nr:hypothetical protein [Erysipelotrichaceae bacterium]